MKIRNWGMNDEDLVWIVLTLDKQTRTGPSPLLSTLVPCVLRQRWKCSHQNSTPWQRDHVSQTVFHRLRPLQSLVEATLYLLSLVSHLSWTKTKEQPECKGGAGFYGIFIASSGNKWQVLVQQQLPYSETLLCYLYYFACGIRKLSIYIAWIFQI